MEISKPAGLYRGGLSFDGIDDYVLIPESPALFSPEFTIAFWLKLNSLPMKYSRVLAKTDGSSEGYAVVFDNSPLRKLYIAVRSASGLESNTAALSKPLPMGIWRHYAFTCYGRKLIPYEDGISLGQIYLKERYEPNSLNDLILGRTSTGLADFASMILSDVQVFGRALSSKQVADIYLGKDIGEGITGHWKLDEGSGDVAIDSTINGNNGKIVGAKYVTNK